MDQKRDVAIFVDMENLFGGYGKDVATVPLDQVIHDIEAEVARSGLGGQTAVARAYANWARGDMAGYRRQLLAGSIKPVQVFSFDHSTKNAADIELVVDALEVAADMPWIELFVIVSGDGDFVPLIRRLHALGKRSFVATTSHPAAGAVNKLLPSVADRFHIIDVAQAPAVVPAQRALPPKKAQPAKKPKPGNQKPQPVKKPQPAQKKSPAPKATVLEHPELKLYKASIHGFIRDDPTLWVNGKVSAQRLGLLLRKRWPNITYKTFGYATLTRFVEEGCGLKTAAQPAGGAVRKIGSSA
ncbi:NYN domain-containing protein [Arthrobacter sp. UYEF21]|uniref:NYN domain-containing protein n=1 Tax=Arthrobacter sp. UYEF21 TaxID=1756364 RepID=UPI003398A6DD